MDDWAKAGNWENATKGKEYPIQISEQVYDEFMGSVPPIEMGKDRAAFISVPLPVQSYFLCGEARTHINNKPVYDCFVKAFDTKYFYIGCLARNPKFG
jgi:hypothetical protein